MRYAFLVTAFLTLSPVLALLQPPSFVVLAATATPPDDSLPAGEAGARARLEVSPRHGEYVNLALPGEEVKLRAYVVFPETRARAGAVLVIHEVFGLSDWVRGVADQLASEGFLAIVPDLLSGYGPGHGGTDAIASRDDAVKLIYTIPPSETRTRLEIARDWAVRQPSASGRWATLGFCWGGARSFESAAWGAPPAGAVVYYGTTPDSATLSLVKAPVLGCYGGDDARVTSTVPAAQRALGGRKGAYEAHVYDGAGHGFLRQQDGRDGANLRAASQAWPRTVEFLRYVLK